MDLEKLLERIKEVENDIRILDNLENGMKEKPDERCAGVSYRGSWTVYFKQWEVQKLLDKRRDGLSVMLGRLLEAKKAAEVTAEGWLNASGGKGEQTRAE